MKKFFLSIFLLAGVLLSCEKDGDITTIVKDAPPQANADADYEVASDQSLVIDFLENDILVDDYILYYIDENSAEDGELTINASGAVIYTPAEDFSGMDEFTYTLCLEGNISEDGCTTGEVVINVLKTFTLTDDDYSFIASEFRGVEGFENQIEGAGNYGNFERRDDRDSYWSNEQIEQALNVLIANKYEDEGVEDGEKFVVTYAIYNGEKDVETAKIIYKSIDLIKNAFQYILVEEDYDLIAASLSSVYPESAANMAQYGNFGRIEGSSSYWSDDMIAEAIQIALSENDDAEEGDLFEVTYDFYDGDSGSESITIEYLEPVLGIPYELVDTDYDLIVSSLSSSYPAATANMAQYGNFNTIEGGDSFWSNDMLEEALLIVLNENFPDAVEGDTYAVTYSFYNGNGGTETIGIEYVAADSIDPISYELISDDYDLIVENLSSVYPEPTSNLAQFGNFNTTEGGSSFWSIDMIDEAVKIVLKSNYPDATEGDLYEVTYSFYNNGLGTDSLTVVYDEDVVLVDDVDDVDDGIYTLASDDYEIIVETLSDIYPEPVANLLQYGNFNTTEGGDSYWSPVMINEALLIVLTERFPNAMQGDIFEITYSYYNNGTGTETVEVEFN